MTEDLGKIPLRILICCEGKETEPQYFDMVANLFRVAVRVNVKIFGNRGQHIKLVDSAVQLRLQIISQDGLADDEIEAWAVCDHDEMHVTISELEAYAIKNNVKLAFTNPNFEVFLLQHFTRSATNASNTELRKLISAEMKARKIASGYSKNDLTHFRTIISNDPQLVHDAVSNSKHMEDRDNTPYTTVHLLVNRLIELGP